MVLSAGRANTFVLGADRRGAIAETKIAAAAVYAAHEVDLVAVYCHAVDRCCLLPIELAADRRASGYA